MIPQNMPLFRSLPEAQGKSIRDPSDMEAYHQVLLEHISLGMHIYNSAFTSQPHPPFTEAPPTPQLFGVVAAGTGDHDLASRCQGLVQV